MRQTRIILLSAAVLLLGLPAAARAQDSLREVDHDPVALLREAWDLTRRNFYDRRVLRDKGWDAILERYRPRAERAFGPEETHALINEMLGELKTSHLALVDGQVFEQYLMAEFNDKTVPQLGCELVELEGGLFVDGILEGSAAELAGLRSGDRVLKIDGLPAIDAEDLRGSGHDPGLPGAPGYVLLVEDGQEVTLDVQRRAGGEVEQVVVTVTKTNMLRAMEASVRVVEAEGRRIGVVHLWHFMNPKTVGMVRDAMRGEFKDVDGLIFDIRGRGGSSQVVTQLLNLFTGRRAIWRRPAVVLTHGTTRSAKEIFALQWKRAGRGPIVGETTQGACIGTIFKTLSDGSAMLLPRIDVGRLTGGVVIEGRGVDPTIAQGAEPLPFRAGRDRIFERGLEVLLEELGGAKARLY